MKFPCLLASTVVAFALPRRGGVSRYFAELPLHLRSLGVRSEVAAPLWLSEHLEPGPMAGVPQA